MDGLDVFKYYWHVDRKEEKILARRKNGGGFVMIRADFSCFDKSLVVYRNKKQVSASYCQALQNNFVDFAATKHGSDYLFQQGNVPIHVS